MQAGTASVEDAAARQNWDGTKLATQAFALTKLAASMWGVSLARDLRGVDLAQGTGQTEARRLSGVLRLTPSSSSSRHEAGGQQAARRQ